MTRFSEKTSNPEYPELEALLDNDLSAREMISRFFEMMMFKNRERYLKSNEQDKGNGYYDRNLVVMGAPQSLAVPRTRKGGFRPSMLPDPWKRMHPEMEEMILSFLASGANKSQVAVALKNMGLPVSDGIIEDFEKTYLEFFNQINNKQILKDMYFLVMDCKQVEVKDKERVKLATVYTAVGIDTEFYKHPLACEIVFEAESKQGWAKFLSSLVQRGLKRILMCISDNFSGITDAVSTVFPEADHQLCVVHLLRNSLKYLAKEDAKRFKDRFHAIQRADDFDSAKEMFLELCDTFQEKAPGFTDKLRRHAQNYVTMARYPLEMRKFVHSSNLVEGINRIIEDKRKNVGGYFRSQEHFQINMAVIIKKMMQGKWKKPHFMMSIYKYEVAQLFALKYQERP